MYTQGFVVYNVTGSRSQAINFNKKDLVNEFMESQSADRLIEVNVMKLMLLAMT